MPLAKSRDDAVVRHRAADNEPITGVAPAQPLDHPARSYPVTVSVNQQRQHHRRRKRRLPGVADLAGRLKLAQVHHTDRVNDQVNDVVLGEPVHHVDRQQKPLAAIRGAEEVGYQCFPWRQTKAELRRHQAKSNYAATSAPTEKRLAHKAPSTTSDRNSATASQGIYRSR